MGGRLDTSTSIDAYLAGPGDLRAAIADLSREQLVARPIPGEGLAASIQDSDRPQAGSLSCGSEVEADLARLQLKSRLERFAGLRLESLEHRGPALSQECLRGADADPLAGDRLPDRELATLPPAAATIRFLLLHDLGLAERARAQSDGREACCWS